MLIPVAGEYGITASFDEFRTYIGQLNDQELNTDEISQVAGGGPKGFGYEVCIYIGYGIGGTSSGGCMIVGGTSGGTFDACIVEGIDVLN